MSRGGHNEQKFRAAIFSSSQSSDWDEAKAEWELHFVYDDSGNDRSCKCEHKPIIQICVIKNRKNGNTLEVGNVCVKRFLRLLSQRIFSVIKRLRWDINKSLNPKALELFRDRGVISNSEVQDYLIYWRRRSNMSDDQKRQKIDINTRILKYIDTETPKLMANARAQGLEI